MSQICSLSGGGIAGIVIGMLVLAGVVAFLCIIPLKPYFIAMFSGAYVEAFKLAGLRFRKVDIMPILEAYILSKKAKLGIKFNELEAHYMAGGSCHGVVSALIKAKDAEISTSFSDLASIDLTSGDVLGVVESVITPKVFAITDIKSTTKDNFELNVTAKITVKARIDRVVGSISRETLESKVKKYISTKISSLTDHKNATPYNLSQDILTSGVDKDNAYQLLSVDITAINVVQDVGSILAMQELERIKVQAQIDADKQKNYAMIQEQQQRIKTQEMKNTVLEAEAEVPKAIAEAIRDGRFSVMDYYKLMNLQADTAMRRAMMGTTGEDK